jgi:D-alanyl-D-alanine carboxypeptidase
MRLKAWISSPTVAGAALLCATSVTPAFADDRYAAIVIDASTNEVLHAENADEQRYPASLTKMMTLYLLFEQLERGELKRTEYMTASKRAAAQPPSRIGLRAGDRINVEDAIHALVTKSANDVAVAVAEHLGGSESRFAAKMTAKARQLGMVSTRYVNASGLPDTSQVTTARDVALLSEALLTDFPQYYTYFQTPDFSWRNVYARNHNGLLGRVEGVDGIKTGYTRMSGFNLASSAMRDGHRIFAVVMGGETARTRDNQMAHLIDMAFEQINARSTDVPQAPAVTYASMPVARVSVQAPPVPAQPQVENGPIAAAVTIEQGDADQPSYVVPVPFFNAARTAAAGSTVTPTLDMSLRGAAAMGQGN